MEVSTHPQRWRNLKQADDRDAEREERATRTNVMRLLCLKDGTVKTRKSTTPEELLESLTERALEERGNAVESKVFVVEDLSRDVIEHLGTQLDIEPAFFREQILDYAWFNPQDRWMDPPSLGIMPRKQRWVTLRYPILRYHRSGESFVAATHQAATWNVYRRPDDDANSRAQWDQPDAVTGIIRARASFWLRAAETGKPAVGA
jgi:hypothetical protein